MATLLAVFSAFALVVAAVGVFGVVSFTVARQARAFAIRNALGASLGQVLSGILMSTAATAAAGAAVGMGAVAIAAPAIGGFLYGVAPRNVLILIGAPAVLVLVALAASLLPALRATRVPLTEVLQRTE